MGQQNISTYDPPPLSSSTSSRSTSLSSSWSRPPPSQGGDKPDSTRVGSKTYEHNMTSCSCDDEDKVMMMREALKALSMFETNFQGKCIDIRFTTQLLQ